MTIEVKIICDSVAPITCKRITTIQARYPRFIHAECKTHRLLKIGDVDHELLQEISLMDDPMLSRNASSSRALPTRKLIDEAINDPAMPVEWHYNEPGMQGRTLMSAAHAVSTNTMWLEARDKAVEMAERMLKLNPHKQTINRLLEPFTHISTVITATEWDNFFDLRCHPDADPTMRALAEVMRAACDASTPTETDLHIPYVTEDIGIRVRDYGTIIRAMKVSAARCARVSYLNHDGTQPDIDKDLKLAEHLLNSRHMSPFEHCAAADPIGRTHAVLTGWESYRMIYESGR